MILYGLQHWFNDDCFNKLGHPLQNNVRKIIYVILSGNITHKSDLGSYQYDQPYRLASAGSRHQNYRYDANGNVTSGGGRRLTWSSFNKPTRMSQGGATTSFSYGPERHRYRRIDQLEGQTTTRLYLGKRYEQISTGGRTTHKYFIYAGNQLAAIHFDEVDHRGDQSDYQTRYLHTDALGSVDLITDGAGGVVDKLSFDPSGKRRTATWRSVQQRLGQASLAPLLTNRGFTGHEHVDALGIIHMNGRIYDPELGRFLSADPTMQHPYSTQGQNRYAYVQKISERYLIPALEHLLRDLPFVVQGLHSDKGSEYIDKRVAKLLDKLRIEFTQSGSRKSNDNALAEGKNAPVVRKLFGHGHIPQRWASLINDFSRQYLNPYINYHQPCLFPETIIDNKGRERKRYPYSSLKAPYQKLKSLPDAQMYLKPGVTFEILDSIAQEKSDNEAADPLQQARRQLFNTIDKQERRRALK